MNLAYRVFKTQFLIDNNYFLICLLPVLLQLYETRIVSKYVVRDVAKIFVQGEDQTKFPVRSQEFRFETVTFNKNLLNKDF